MHRKQEHEIQMRVNCERGLASRHQRRLRDGFAVAGHMIPNNAIRLFLDPAHRLAQHTRSSLELDCLVEI